MTTKEAPNGMTDVLRYCIDEKGNLKAALFAEGRPAPESGVSIRCAADVAPKPLRMDAVSGDDGWARFDFNVLDFLLEQPHRFRIRCEARAGRETLRTPWSEPYEPVHYTPAASGSARDADLSVRLDLGGEWRCCRWPFKAAEGGLLGGKAAGGDWTATSVPGAAHVRDEFESPGPQRDEMHLTHVDPKDGFILQREFHIPASFRGKLLRLRADGIYPGGVIFLNGKKAGEVWTGLNSAEFDVTGLFRVGRVNTIAVRLYRKHPFARLDMVRWAMDYCGIHRPIFIQAIPSVHLAGLRAEATLKGKRGPGLLRGSLCVGNRGKAAARVRVEVQLYDRKKTLLRKPAALFRGRVAPGAACEMEYAIETAGVQPWSAEKPGLYRAVFSVIQGNKVVQTVTRRLGFRRFDLKKERPLLNGVPIKFRGINRLECHPETGLAQDEDWLRKEVFTLKRANINGVRTHLCSSSRFVEECDEQGLYVIQEIPIDWAAEKPDIISEVGNLGVFLNRIQRTILRDRENPSVLAWGVGNENLVHDEEKKEAFWTHLRLFHNWAKRLDPTRPTMFPPPGPLKAFRAGLQAEVGDIADIHYTFNPVKEMQETGKMVVYRDWKESKTFTRKELVARGWSGVWFSSEYFCFGAIPELLEAPYMSFIEEEHPEERFQRSDTTSLFKKRFLREWGYMEKDPTCLGGAFFHFKDPAVGKPWKWIAYDEGLQWGIVDPWLVPNHLYWIVRSIFAPVRTAKQVRVKKGQRSLRIPVANLHSFTNLAECRCYLQESKSRNYLGMTLEWEELPMNVPPGAERDVRVPLTKDAWKALDEGRPVIARFTFADPAGYIITTTDTMVLPEKLTQDIKARGGDFILAEVQ